jgi:hypothetical protein
MDFRVEIRDTDFNILEFLENEITSLSWDYSRIGGCGSFSFELPREFCNERFISGDFNIRIYIRNETTKAYDLWYQGLVEDKKPSISGDKEKVSVTGHGYQAQLSRIQISESYSSTEISVIVKDILDTYITPNTDITYETADIEATGFTADTLDFSTDAESALKTCADTVGGIEWGVDKDRKFFFKARSSTVGYRFWIGKNITGFNEDQSFKDIVNRVVVQGKEIAGVPYTFTANDLSSQTKYNLRTKVIQNSAISTEDVATQFASSMLDEYSDVVRKASCSLVNYQTRIEATVPIPLFVLKGVGVRYGEKKYYTFLYSGEINRYIERANYSINDNAVLTTKLTLGQLPPNSSEQIVQLKYKLEQLRTANL